MGLWWLCCPIGSGMRTAFIEDGPANGLLENGDDSPPALQHQDGGASSTEEEPPQTRGRARTEDSTTAALLPSEPRASNGAPAHRRTTSSRWSTQPRPRAAPAQERPWP